MAKVLKADNPEHRYAWYEQLGLKRAPPAPVLFPWRYADSEERGMTVWSLFPRDTTYFGPNKQSVIINDIVDDLDGMLQALRDAGVRMEDRREEHAYGKFSWVTDPEGNRIELWQPHEGV